MYFLLVSSRDGNRLIEKNVLGQAYSTRPIGWPERLACSDTICRVLQSLEAHITSVDSLTRKLSKTPDRKKRSDQVSSCSFHLLYEFQEHFYFN